MPAADPMIQPCRPGTESAKPMQQRSKPQKRALRAVIFLLIVVLLYSAAANVLSVNNTWDMRHIRGFYLEPKDSLDVVMPV